MKTLNDADRTAIEELMLLLPASMSRTKLIDVYANLSDQVKAIFRRELGRPEVSEPSVAIEGSMQLIRLLYSRETTLTDALRYYAYMLVLCRAYMVRNNKNFFGVWFDASFLIESLKHSSFAELLQTKRVGIKPFDSHFRLFFEDAPVIDLSVFCLRSLTEYSGKSVVLIETGGGSGVCTMYAYALALEKAGASIAGIISFRALTTGSAGRDGKLGEERRIYDALENPYPDTYLVGAATTANGRFYESLVASKTRIPIWTMLVGRAEGKSLADRISELFRERFPEVQAVLVGDVGGDIADNAIGNQDFEVAKAFGAANLDADVRVEMDSPGIDSPDYLFDVLKASGAEVRDMPIEFLLLIYGVLFSFGFMSGDEEKPYGLTTPILLHGIEALVMGDGGRLRDLPIPAKFVSASNPWIPFFFVRPQHGVVVTMPIGQFLSAVDRG